uniref:Uncharacterized protein n=1 Tax=Acrobeloides nanus TaxID=290746 RepID=A0A914EAG7_9BILA
MNFHVANNKEIREQTLAYFMHKFEKDSDVIIVTNRTNWQDYLLELGDTKFVISPPDFIVKSDIFDDIMTCFP